MTATSASRHSSFLSPGRSTTTFADGCICASAFERLSEPEASLSPMRMKGMECNTPSGFAEVFRLLQAGHVKQRIEQR